MLSLDQLKLRDPRHVCFAPDPSGLKSLRMTPDRTVSGAAPNHLRRFLLTRSTQRGIQSLRNLQLVRGFVELAARPSKQRPDRSARPRRPDPMRPPPGIRAPRSANHGNRRPAGPAHDELPSGPGPVARPFEIQRKPGALSPRAASSNSQLKVRGSMIGIQLQNLAEGGFGFSGTVWRLRAGPGPAGSGLR